MKLKEIVEICYGKNQKQVEVEKSDIPILGTGGIIGYSSKPLYDKESVLIGRKGTIGMPFYVNKPFWTIDTLFYTKINTNIVIPKFLYYLLCTIGLSRYSEGAAIPSLTTKTLYEIDLKVPNKDIQQHIVNTIGTIDDLIENYQNKVETLKDNGLKFYKYKTSKNSIETKVNSLNIKYGISLPDSKRSTGEIPLYASNGLSDYISISNAQNAIVFGCRGTLGNVFYQSGNLFVLNTAFYINNPSNYGNLYYSLVANKGLTLYQSGAAQPQITIDAIKDAVLTVPSDNDLNHVLDLLSNYENVIVKLKKVKQLLLAKFF